MFRKLMIVLLAIAAGPVFAQICPVSNKVPTPNDGIGDGCSTQYGGVSFVWAMPSLGIHNAVFKPACDNHDKCWTQLGADYPACDSQFLSDMKDRCDSKFNKYLMPVENLACKSMANVYKEAVVQYRTLIYSSAESEFQYEARARSFDLHARINNNQCGTTPERTTLYAPGLINQVNGAFLSAAGRKPTLYEFLDAVNQGDRIADFFGWYAAMLTRAQNSASVVPPAVGWYKTSPGLYGVTFTANPAASTYLWNLSSGGGTTQSVTFSFPPPMFNRTVRFDGFLKVTNAAGVRNMALVETSIVLPGTCTSRNGEWVNCD